MANIIFRGARIRYVDQRYDDDSGAVFHKIHVSADCTDEARELCGFEDGADLPEGVASAKIALSLPSSWMTLTPNKADASNHELEIEVTSLDSFGIFRSGKEEKAKEELRFIVTTNVTGAGAVLENYQRICGNGKIDSAMNIAYAEQGTIPGTIIDDRQAELKDDAGETMLNSVNTAGPKRVPRTTRGKATGGVVTMQ